MFCFINQHYAHIYKYYVQHVSIPWNDVELKWFFLTDDFGGGGWRRGVCDVIWREWVARWQNPNHGLILGRYLIPNPELFVVQ